MSRIATVSLSLSPASAVKLSSKVKKLLLENICRNKSKCVLWSRAGDLIQPEPTLQINTTVSPLRVPAEDKHRVQGLITACKVK